jgi:hypothetical protein
MKTSDTAVSNRPRQTAKASGSGSRRKKATGAARTTRKKSLATSDLPVAPVLVREAMDGACPHCSRKVVTIPDMRVIEGRPVKIGRICHECANLRPKAKQVRRFRRESQTYEGYSREFWLEFWKI